MNTIGPLIINIDGVTLSKDEAKLLEHNLIGSVILFSHNYNNFKQLGKLITEIKNVKENILISVDHEGGRIQRFKDGFTVLPSFGEIGRLYDDDEEFAESLSAACGFVSGYELSKIGVDVNFSPVVDIKHFSGQLLHDRCFGERAAKVRRLASSYISASTLARTIPVIKHFPGHGVTDGDTHIDHISSDLTLEDMLDEDLIPFIDIQSSYDIPIMTSHIKFPKVDEKIITYSQKWLTDISKKIFPKKPCFISDDIEMEAATNNETITQRVISALEAGCNMVIATTMLQQDIIKSKKSFEYFKKYYLAQELIDYCKDFCNDEIMAMVESPHWGVDSFDNESREEQYKEQLSVINKYKS